MSDTPRTDKNEYKTWSEGNQGMGDNYAELVVPSDFARQLERELNATHKSLREAMRELTTFGGFSRRIAQWERDIANAGKNENDQI